MFTVVELIVVKPQARSVGPVNNELSFRLFFFSFWFFYRHYLLSFMSGSVAFNASFPPHCERGEESGGGGMEGERESNVLAFYCLVRVLPA